MVSLCQIPGQLADRCPLLTCPLLSAGTPAAVVEHLGGCGTAMTMLFVLLLAGDCFLPPPLSQLGRGLPLVPTSPVAAGL